MNSEGRGRENKKGRREGKGGKGRKGWREGKVKSYL